MSCIGLAGRECLAVVAVGGAGGGQLGGVAHSVDAAIAWVVSATFTWWVQVPSPGLAGDPAIGALQRWMLPVAMAVAVGATLVAGAKVALTRKANPLIDVGAGLMTIAATSALGVVLPTLLLRAGDAWSSWVLTESTGGHFAARLTAALSLGVVAGPVIVIILGVVAIVMSVIQAVLMLFRQAALVVLAGMLPLAAAGTLVRATRAWFRRVTGWMLALIFYKPVAATVYATAFTLIGRGRDPRTVLMGFAMLLLSLVALPVLMKFFTWTTGSVGSPGGGGFLGTALSGVAAVGALRGWPGGGSSVADQARRVSAQLGQPAGTAGAGGATAGAWGAAAGPNGATRATGAGVGPAHGVAGAAGSAGVAVAVIAGEATAAVQPPQAGE